MWVELTLAQKRVYRAILEGKRELLAGKGASRASLPSLNNIYMELRKCCNHPWLIKGVEAEQTRGVADGEALQQALLSSSGNAGMLISMYSTLGL